MESSGTKATVQLLFCAHLHHLASANATRVPSFMQRLIGEISSCMIICTGRSLARTKKPAPRPICAEFCGVVARLVERNTNESESIHDE